MEFLSLLAFVAREAHSMKGVTFQKAKKFSPNDLEMAYAFHNKFGHQPKISPSHQQFQTRGKDESSHANQKQRSPGHHHQPPVPPHYRLDVSSPQHALRQSMPPQPQEMYLDEDGQGPRGGGFANRMSQRPYGESFGMLNQSSRYSGQQQDMQFGGPAGHSQPQGRDDHRMNMLLAANPGNEPHPFHHSPQHQGGFIRSLEHERQMRSSTMELYPMSSQQRPTAGHHDMLDASRTSGKKTPNMDL